MKEIITSTAGQCTARERDMVDAIKRKFGMITFVFYLCWTPNFVNGFLLWILWMDLPVTSVISVWYVMVGIYYIFYTYLFTSNTIEIMKLNLIT